jgi:hypothetical protein
MQGRFAALVLLMLAAGGAAGAGLCTAAETAFFSCQTAGKKWIGVCGSPSGAVQYRFGRPGRIELAYPADPADAADSLYLTHYTRFQVDRSELTFTNQGVGYAVFAYRERGRRSAGVRMTLAPGKDREIACAGPIASALPKLHGVLGCDPDNALSLGECR